MLDRLELEAGRLRPDPWRTRSGGRAYLAHWLRIRKEKISRKGRQARKDVALALACFGANLFFVNDSATELGSAGKRSLRYLWPLREIFWLPHRRFRPQGGDGGICNFTINGTTLETEMRCRQSI
jgi:hypothetical protein